MGRGLSVSWLAPRILSARVGADKVGINAPIARKSLETKGLGCCSPSDKARNKWYRDGVTKAPPPPALIYLPQSPCRGEWGGGSPGMLLGGGGGRLQHDGP